MGRTPEGTSTSLIDIHAVADRLAVSVRYVRRLVAERRIPYVKFGHFLRFDPQAIDEWVERARVDDLWPPTPPSHRRVS